MLARARAKARAHRVRVSGMKTSAVGLRRWSVVSTLTASLNCLEETVMTRSERSRGCPTKLRTVQPTARLLIPPRARTAAPRRGT